jgi:hypothetical protein
MTQSFIKEREGLLAIPTQVLTSSSSISQLTLFLQSQEDSIRESLHTHASYAANALHSIQYTKGFHEKLKGL